MVGVISKGIGKGRVNDPSDVLVVEQLLVRHGRWTFPQGLPVANGTADAATIAAIETFQRNAMGLLRPDGAVDPGGMTISLLGATGNLLCHSPGDRGTPAPDMAPSRISSMPCWTVMRNTSRRFAPSSAPMQHCCVRCGRRTGRNSRVDTMAKTTP
jgi:hypothetical protein